MATLKDRFEGIVNNDNLKESEAIKICITHNRELQKEVERLKENQKESKLDKLLTEYIHWAHDYDPPAVVLAHVICGFAIIGMAWLLTLLGSYGYTEFKKISSNITPTESYYMSSDNIIIDGKSIQCYQIIFQREDGAHVKAAPCIPNREEAFMTLAQLQELRKNGKSKTTQPDINQEAGK